MKFQRINLAGVFLGFGIVLQVTWYSLLYINFVSSPELKGADFISFYTAGKIFRSQQPDKIYDLPLQHDLQQNIIGKKVSSTEFLPFLHPPFLVPLQALIAVSDYKASYLLWSLVLLAFLAIDAIILWFLLRNRGWEKKKTGIVGLSIVLFFPIFISILKGQDTVFLLLGVLTWLYGFERKKDWLAGFGLALTLIRPQVGLVLAFAFMFTRWKQLAWYFLGIIILSIYSLLLLDVQGTVNFIYTLLVSVNGEGYGLNQAGMFNLTGLLLRVVPRLGPGLNHIIAWVVFGVAIVCICVVSGRSKFIGYRHISLAISLSLFTAPHLHYHDLALLIIPLLGSSIAVESAGRMTTWQVAVLPTAISVLLLFSEFWDPARFSVPYLLMVVLPTLIWRVEKKRESVYQSIPRGTDT